MNGEEEEEGHTTSMVAFNDKDFNNGPGRKSVISDKMLADVIASYYLLYVDMSRPTERTPPQPTLPSARSTHRRPSQSRIASRARSPPQPKHKPASVASGKPLRTSKTTEKLVLLPSAPQTKPLLVSPGVGYPGAPEEDVLGYETDAGLVREYKSAAERMNKIQREKANCSRITTYCLAEGMKMKLLTGFLKREHNVQPRVFDEATYVVSITLCSVHSTAIECLIVARPQMYHLPLLPGYSPSTSVRSSAAFTRAHLGRLSEAEENGYQGTYFATTRSRSSEESSSSEDDGYVTEGREDGYVAEGSPINTKNIPHTPMFNEESDADAGGETEADAGSITDTAGETEAERDQPREGEGSQTPAPHSTSSKRHPEPEPEEPIAEAIFFAYGVVVFYGFSEVQERSIIDDLTKAGIFRRMIKENDWEIEECHFAVRLEVRYCFQ